MDFHSGNELQEIIERIKLIERAKGILLRRQYCSTESEAHRKLQRAACNSNRKLIEVAKQIIDSEDLLVRS